MAGQGGIGSPLSSRVLDQIKAREQVIGKPEKSRDDLLFLNANTVWVKLRSSVNELTPDSIESVKNSQLDSKLSYTIEASPEKAKSFILVGGTKASGQDARGGVSLEPNVIDTSAVYNNYPGLGFRPMPGITDFSVKSKNTFGTLMEAVVNFVVWTVEDLEICELLYFRPGYTALLEWGHTLWVDSKGNLHQTGPEFGTISDEEFFTERTFSYFEKKIQCNRIRYEGNYDGLVGFITNFSFSFRTDGGYDCTVRIVSRGVILDNLQPNKTSNLSDNVEEASEDDNKELESIYHHIFQLLKKPSNAYNYADSLTAFDKKVPNPDLVDFRLGKQQKGVSYKGFSKQDYGAFNGRIHLELVGQDKEPFKRLDDFMVFARTMKIEDGEKGNNALFYIRLGDFLMLINRFNALYDEKSKPTPPTNTKEEEPCEETVGVSRLPEFDLSSGQKFYTFSDHFSIDPIVAVLPEPPKGVSSDSEANEVYKDCYLEGLHEPMKSHAQQLGGTDDILNIMVSTYFLERKITDFIRGNQGNVESGMYDLVQDILGDIGVALGGVNQFGIHFNHLNGSHSIIDRSYIGPDSEEIPMVDLSTTGVSSFVKSITLTSTISNNVATQVAVAAQGTAENFKENLSTILKWNLGAIDRHMMRKLQGNETSNEPVAQKSVKEVHRNERKKKRARRKFLRRLKKLYRKFNNGEYNEEQAKELQSEASLEIKKAQGESKSFVQGIVPVELSFKMLGIHGFVVGTCFKLAKGLLPRKYDNWGYIITGVEHVVDDGKWMVDVKTQFYSVRSKTKEVTSPEQPRVVKREPPVSGEQTETTVGCVRSAVVPPLSANRSSRSVNKRLAALKAHQRLFYGAKKRQSGWEIGVSGLCARWTYNFAEYFTSELNGKPKSVNGPTKAAEGNANQSSYHNKLLSLGYKMQTVGTGMRKSELISWLSSYPFYYGDIVVYWASDGDSSLSHVKYGHTQYYLGDVHPKGGNWASSVDLNYSKSSNFIYGSRKSDCWTLIIFTLQ